MVYPFERVLAIMPGELIASIDIRQGAVVRVRRCAILLIEPREQLSFSLESLCAGGDGIDAQIDLLALAPHLAVEIGISDDEAKTLNSIIATQWVPFDTLAQRFDSEILNALIEKGLLISDDEKHASHRLRDDALRSAHWQAHAAISHSFGRWQGITSGEATANASLCTMTELTDRLGTPPPHVLERAAPAQRIPLTVSEPTALDELLSRRVTCRNFDTVKTLEMSVFSHVMRRVFGSQAAYEIHAENVVIKRTSPSGGGLHPTEAYLLVQRVEGIAPGLYHYHPVDHALEPLPAPPDLTALARLTVAAQQHYMNAPVMIVLASRFPRMFWKYRNHSKAYRVAILDVGHLSQTLYISATEFGLGAFITAAMNEIDIEKAFGIDGVVEGPIAVVGFGHRAPECETFEFDPNRKVWSEGVEQPK